LVATFVNGEDEYLFKFSDSLKGENYAAPQVASLCKDVINMTLGAVKGR